MKLLCLALICFPICVFAQGGLPSQPYIYVEGKAQIEKAPDMVTLRFEVVARDADQSKANQHAQAIAGKVLALLNERKIAENDVIAQDLRSEPQYEDEETYGRKKGKLIGYIVTRNFIVKVHDVPAFPKLVNDLIGIGFIEFSSIEPVLSDQQKRYEEVAKKALIDAHDQAEKSLKSVGMKIDSVFAISPVTFPDIQQQIFRSRSTGSAEAERAIIGPNPLEYRLAPVIISESIHVIYLISPAK